MSNKPGFMKAVVCHELGPPDALHVEEIKRPVTGSEQVRIRVAACSINFPDLLIISGQYQERPGLPFVPGQEVAGVVEDTGADVTGIEPGQAVIAATYQGGLAQYANANFHDVYEMPASMPMEIAAGFPAVFGTSYHALKQRARLKPGETLLVLGAAGGVGLAAVQIGAVMGARVIAAARGEQKIEFLRNNGADELIDYGKDNLKDAVNDLTGGRGADVIYDPVGGDLFDQATRCINWNGRILVVGFTSGRIPQLPANLALLKGSSIVGVFYGRFNQEQPQDSARNMAELFDLYSRGKLQPHVHKTFPLEQAADAMNCLKNREAIGKVIVSIDH
jgi:NADPH2:quinone reductase